MKFVLILFLITEIIADNRLKDGCQVKETEAPWVVYIRNCASSKENSAAPTETTPEPTTRQTIKQTSPASPKQTPFIALKWTRRTTYRT